MIFLIRQERRHKTCCLCEKEKHVKQNGAWDLYFCFSLKNDRKKKGPQNLKPFSCQSEYAPSLLFFRHVRWVRGNRLYLNELEKYLIESFFSQSFSQGGKSQDLGFLTSIVMLCALWLLNYNMLLCCALLYSALHDLRKRMDLMVSNKIRTFKATNIRPGGIYVHNRNSSICQYRRHL